jgi:AraC-like DNA-binding protein
MSKTTKDYFRYLYISSGDRLWGLNVTGVGAMVMEPGDPYPPGSHPSAYQFSWPQRRKLSEYQFVYVPVGEGEFESGAGGRHKIVGGTVLLTFPGDWHRYRPTPSIGWQEYWIGFEGEIADRLVDRGIISAKQPILRTFQNADLQHTCESLMRSVSEDQAGLQQILAAGVLTILGTALAAERVGPNGDRHAVVIKQAKEALANCLEKPIRIKRLAARCHLSEAQFRRVFRQHVGMSPNQYYLQARVARAKELLSGGVMSIKQIAASLQFEDQFHFSKTFRKQTGVSPSQWRGSRARN